MMVKKFSAIILAIFMVFSCAAIISSADTTPTFTVSNATGAPGEKVKVAVTCEGNPGIASWSVKLSFDTNVMELDSSDMKGVFGTATGGWKDDKYVILWTSDTSENNASNGKLAELTFKINKNAAEGDYEINLEYDEDEVASVIKNSDGAPEYTNINFKVKKGKVSVAKKVESKPESKVESKVASKPESKIESKPESKVESKTESTIGTVSVVSAAVSGVSSDKSASGSDATVSGSSSKNSSTTSNTSGTSSTSSSTSSTNSSKSSSTSSSNNPSSPKTGTATPLAGTVVLLLASAAAMVSLGKRKED